MSIVLIGASISGAKKNADNKQVYDSSVIAYPPIVHQHGLVTTVLGLHMQLDSSHFEDGLMRVKCLTSISPLIPIQSMEGNAAEARESLYIGNGNGNSNGNGNRKTNHAQRKPPLTDSREVFLLGKCKSLKASSFRPLMNPHRQRFLCLFTQVQATFALLQHQIAYTLNFHSNSRNLLCYCCSLLCHFA